MEWNSQQTLVARNKLRRPCSDLPGNSLCALFQRQARATWKLLATARKRQCRVDEETITNLNVLAFAGYKSQDFQITSFSNRKERRTGGDWEIWFVDTTGRGCGVRIQAKVIDLTADRFSHLHYKYPANGGRLPNPEYQ
jgi:hypothetical protein